MSRDWLIVFGIIGVAASLATLYLTLKGQKRGGCGCKDKPQGRMPPSCGMGKKGR